MENTQAERAGVDTAGIETATRFLSAIFQEGDVFLLRPVEAWTEKGKKQSRVDYRNTCHRSLRQPQLEATLRGLWEAAPKGHLNLFFGTCPRYGLKGQYDLAWQIRTVRCLWVDIDNVTAEEAIERVRKAGLPKPSIVVNSGNGVHLYWLLDQPYLIDDVEDPPAVLTEWVEKRGKKKPRKYILKDGARFYLDKNKHLTRLSAKALHIQDVLSGMAKQVGGDHTHDVARLLRLPGSLNRKDGRNGAEPRPTALLRCEPSLRYPLSAFEPFKCESPESERARKIEAMPLPTPRKPTAKVSDTLEERIAVCKIAEAGQRSEADFAMCCLALRKGVAKEDVWKRVEEVGKFKDEGERYFNITWAAAEYAVKSETYENLAGKTLWETPAADDNEPQPARPTIEIAPQTPVADTLREITDCLIATKECYNRCDQMVVVHQDDISPILTPAELAGLLNPQVEFYYIDSKGGAFKPLSSSYGSTWLNNRHERGRLQEIKLFTRNPVYTADWRITAPGFDPHSSIYYAGAAVEPRKGTEHLDKLLQDFCFKSAADQANYIGILVTSVLIPRFIGTKPAALFNGNQAGLGKTVLAQIIAILRDGKPSATVSFNPSDEEFEKRLGALVHRGATTIIIDNAKSRGRNPKIESACLERSITDPILSFRLLGKSQEIRAENSHIFCITANSADVSPDLVSRSVVINLEHEGDPKRRTFQLADPEGYAEEHRTELLGELLGMVERWKDAGMPCVSVNTRFNKRGWGNVVGGILHVCGLPDFLANADAAAEELDDSRRDFVELIRLLADHPQGSWTPAELVEQCVKHDLLKSELGDGSARSMATRFGKLAGRFIDELCGIDEERVAVLRRVPDRKGFVYRVAVTESAER